MKMNLQYFADQPSSGAQPTSQSSQSSTVSSASSASAKYTQDDVNKMMATKAKVASEAAVRSFQSSMADSVSAAVAHQKKVDNMNATELKQEQEKEHTAKLQSLIAENKQFKQSMADAKALNETNQALINAKISNPSTIAPLMMNVDPQKRSNNISAFTKWLRDHDDDLKNELLKGHNEPQTGGNAAQIPTSQKDINKMNPLEIMLLSQKDPSIMKKYQS